MVAYRINVNIGDYFDGKYTILSSLGEGTYGTVYKVHGLDRKVRALKILRLWEVSSDLHESLIYKFKQEFETSRIESEYLIHSKDFGIVNGNPYIVMEYCPGGDLTKCIGQDEKRLAGYARDILEGLYALHSAGKIHRDLKPENVLVRENGHAALTDFGVVGEMEKSKRMSEVDFLSRRPRQAWGTPLYMSPEIFDRQKGGVTYLPTVDIWSFGVMMYEILTNGAFPFGNIEKFEDLPIYQEKAKQGRWDFNKLRDSGVDNGWIPIIGKCLQPSFKNRYQSVLELMNDMTPMIGDMSRKHVLERKSRSPYLSRIVITQGDNVGASYHFEDLIKSGKRMVRVGRDYQNDIVLVETDNTYISRLHFTIEKSQNGGYWTIFDGQWNKNERRWVTSTNGTYLNSTPVPPKERGGLRVFTGDIITAGEFKLKVE